MRNLYCGNCGYDLATLVPPSGGRIRCPECGSFSAGVAVSTLARTPWAFGFFGCFLGWFAMVVVVIMSGMLMPFAASAAIVLGLGPLAGASAAAIKGGHAARMRNEPRWLEFAFVDALLVGLVASFLNILLCLLLASLLVLSLSL